MQLGHLSTFAMLWVYLGVGVAASSVVFGAYMLLWLVLR